MARHIRSIQVWIDTLRLAHMGRDAPVVRDGNRRGTKIWKAKIEELLAEGVRRGGAKLPLQLAKSAW